MQVGTSPAGVEPLAPGVILKTPSVTMQNKRTPVLLKVIGADEATNEELGPPVGEKPAAANWYPLLMPVDTVTSRMQAAVELGVQGALVLPRLARSGA